MIRKIQSKSLHVQSASDYLGDCSVYYASNECEKCLSKNRFQDNLVSVQLLFKESKFSLKLLYVANLLTSDTYFLQSVQPSTGDIIYDEFEDGPGFTELETHFEHISPEELLLPVSVSESTNTFIKEYVTRLQRSVY